MSYSVPKKENDNTFNCYRVEHKLFGTQPLVSQPVVHVTWTIVARGREPLSVLLWLGGLGLLWHRFSARRYLMQFCCLVVTFSRSTWAESKG